MTKASVSKRNSLLISRDELSLLEAEAEIIHKSNMYAIPLEKLKLIIIKGYRLGFSPTEAVTRIVEVNKKLTIDGQAMLAIVMGSGLLEDIKTQEGEDYCTVSLKRKGIASYVNCTFTLAEAQQANLTNKGIWVTYPKQMLYWRAFSMAARRLFADVIMGLYTTEEMENSFQSVNDIIIPEPTDEIDFVDGDEDTIVLESAPTPKIPSAYDFLMKEVRLFGADNEGKPCILDVEETQEFWQTYLLSQYGNYENVSKDTLFQDKNKLFSYLIEQRRPIVLKANERGTIIIKKEKENVGLAMQTLLGQVVATWVHSQVYGEPIERVAKGFGIDTYNSWMEKHRFFDLVVQPIKFSETKYVLRVINFFYNDPSKKETEDAFLHEDELDVEIFSYGEKDEVEIDPIEISRAKNKKELGIPLTKEEEILLSFHLKNTPLSQ